MEINSENTRFSGKKAITAAAAVMMAFVLFAVSAFAWFVIRRKLAAYAPIANPEMLYIGAGHRNFDAVNHAFEDSDFEDIRYLYLNGIDVTAGREYYDYVFCVYGTMVGGYKIQLAYTTNNQFSYELYPASESTVDSVGAVAYTTHTSTPQTYYYSVAGAAISGSFLNDRTVSGETLADTSKHTATYGSYNNVDKYAEPIYWQTNNAESGYLHGDFINYYILRVRINSKTVNDRETDVICIAAKSHV